MAKFFNKIISKIDLAFLRNIVIVCTFVALFLASLAIGIYYNRIFDTMAEQTLQTLQQNIEQISTNISYKLSNADDLSFFLIGNNEFSNIVNRSTEEDSTAQQLDDFKKLKSIAEVVYSGSNIYSLRIFLSSEKLYAKEEISFFDITKLDETGLGKAIDSNSGLRNQNGWTCVYEESYLDKQTTFIVTNIKLLHDRKNYDSINAVIAVDIEVEKLSDILSSFTVDYAEIQIISDTGQIIASNNRSEISTLSHLPISEILNASNNTESGIINTTINDVDSYIVYGKIKEANWFVTITMPMDKINKNNSATTVTFNLIIISIVIVLFIALAMIIFAGISNKMIKNVKDIAVHIQNEGPNTLPDVSTKDKSLGLIQKYMNDMANDVIQLEQKASEAKLKERDYRLQALQAQINPHFLYNTLDTINWFALKRKDMDISRLVTSLAKYFRLTLSKGKVLVPLSDEIELIKSYIIIQQMRFGDKVKWKIDVSSKCNSCIMPKLTLQPIIENALMHGIQNTKTGSGTISIRARIHFDALVISVKDNGVGMSKEKVNSLLCLETKNKNTQGYGLGNVNERIQLLYGKSHGLRIYSKINVGTRVFVHLPIKRNIENSD